MRLTFHQQLLFFFFKCPQALKMLKFSTKILVVELLLRIHCTKTQSLDSGFSMPYPIANALHIQKESRLWRI